jgi:hypothetical protein
MDPHRTNAASASTTKAAGKGSAESAAQKRARERALIKEAVDNGRFQRLPPEAHSEAHSRQAIEELEDDKRGLQQALGHDEDGGAEDWEKARTAVWKALGHDADGKCPANWLTDDAANARREISLNHHLPQPTAEEAQQFAACGWWFCQHRARLTESQWEDLSGALQILQSRGIDPNGIDLVELAEEYASSADWRALWPTFRPLTSFLRGQPTAQTRIDPQLLRQAELAEQAGDAKHDVPLHNFVTCLKAREWAPAVAAALLFLFGLTKRDENLETLKTRVAVTASRSK